VARRVGDILTIQLEESTNASKSAVTTTKKNTTTTLPGANILGGTLTIHGRNVLSGSLADSSQFDGEGTSAQSNQLSGYISVTVAKRLANGNLLVRGQKWITLNQGREYVRIQGIVRPVDIGPDNVVPSYSVADATISYGGQGTLADSNTKSWAGALLRFALHAVLAMVPLMHRFRTSFVVALCLLPALAPAERVKDLAVVSGVRSNQLVGYGLVVGLDGTGDQTTQTPFTVQSIMNMLEKYGVTIRPPSFHSSRTSRRSP